MLNTSTITQSNATESEHPGTEARARDGQADSLHACHLFVDERLRVLFVDADASAFLSDNAKSLCVVEGHLRARHRAWQDGIRALIADSIANGVQNFSTSSPDGQLHLQFRQLQAKAGRAGSWTALIILVANSNASGLVEVAKSYRLTRAEQRLLEALCNGRRLGSYAASVERSIHTVRTQSRNLCSKLGVKGQLEAIHLVLGTHAA